MLFALIAALDFKDRKDRREFDAKISSWAHNGRVGEPPLLPYYRITALTKKLERIFGYPASFEVDRDNKSLIFQKDGKRFRYSSLSDGEQQILLLSVLLFAAAPDRCTFFVDEPELHLNEGLAIEMWERIEENFPSASFIYASHSINFCTRPSVDGIFAVSNEVPKRLLVDDIPPSFIRSLVGGRVQILKNDQKVVACEDDLMELFLSDAIDDPAYIAVKVGDSSLVKAAVRNSSIDRILAVGHTKRCGVIDRDEMDDDTAMQMVREDIVVMPYNETESVLMEPALVSLYLSASVGRAITEEEVRNNILQAAVSAREIAIKKLADFLHSQKAGKLRYDWDRGAVVNARMDPDHDLVGVFEVRALKITDALRNQNIEDILRLIPGKEMYCGFQKAVQRNLKCQLSPPIQKYRELRKDIDFLGIMRSLPSVRELVFQIKDRL